MDEERPTGRPRLNPLWPIRRVGGLMGAAVYVVTEEEPLLVDVGHARDVPRILAALDLAGLRPRDLRYIVLTHHHADHAGGAAALREATGAQLLAHVADAPYVQGRAPRPSAGGPIGALATRLLVGRCPPARVDERLFGGETVGGLRVVHTPGHTPGHVCLYLARRRSLFVGDLCRTAGRKGDRLAEVPHFLTANVPLSRRSIREVASLDVDAIYPGHGQVIYADAGEPLRDLARQVAAK